MSLWKLYENILASLSPELQVRHLGVSGKWCIRGEVLCTEWKMSSYGGGRTINLSPEKERL